ncbi:Uncharacterised protein [Klebsiella pneumoniae]|nr:Uncharacterised protein [Klebsiella pneumoniae]
MQDGTKRRGRTIDKYDVTGSNCTTHSVEGLKFAGSKVFEHGYTSTTTQLPIDIEEDFTIPVSLQRYLESKSADFSSILVVEMTNTFKQQYPNTENKSPQSMGGSAKNPTVCCRFRCCCWLNIPLLRRYSRRFHWEALTMMNKKFWIRWVSIALICAAYTLSCFISIWFSLLTLQRQ